MPIQHVGRPIKRLEDPKLVQGRDAYVNDVRLDGALSLAFARSPHAHAVIRRIDTTAMRADGSKFPIELAIARVPQPGPAVFIGYVRDLTS